MQITRYFQKGNYIFLIFDNDISLKIRYETFVKFNLSINCIVVDDDLQKIKDDSDIYDIKDKIFDLISRRPHSKDELRKKLLRKKFPLSLINETLDYLENKNFIDQDKFIIEYTKQLLSKKYSKIQIINKLKQKGISDEKIDEMLKNFYNSDNDYENAKQLAIKKLKSYQNITPFSQKQKLFQFLYRKGFDIDVIYKILDEIIKSD